jgi:hypothetical protein
MNGALWVGKLCCNIARCHFPNREQMPPLPRVAPAFSRLMAPLRGFADAGTCALPHAVLLMFVLAPGAQAQQGPTLEVRDEIRSGSLPQGERRSAPYYLAAPVGASDASGDARPLSLTVRQGWRRNSNLYALSSTAAQAQPSLAGGDTVMVTGLRAAYDRRAGAQEIALWADVSNNSYRRFDDLDNVAWSAGGQLNWQLGRQWYGTLAGGSQRLLNPFTNQNRTIRNQLALNSLASSVGYRFGTRWSVFAGADFASRRNGESLFRESDLDQTGLETGVRFQHPSGDADGSVVLRTVRGRFPNAQTSDALGEALAQPLDNAFRDRSLLLRGALRLSAPTYVVGEIGVTARRFDTLSSRNFSGLTGSFLWQWQPTDPLRVEAYVRRNLGPIQLASASSVDAVQTGLSVSWRIAPKVTLGAHAGWDRYVYAGDPVGALGIERRDRVRVIGVSAAWQAWRNVQLIADHRRELRSSNYSVFNYDVDITSLFVQARFD